MEEKLTKSQQRALEAYPVCINDHSVEKGFDWNEEWRDVFQQGYEQAEKDKALTIQDLELIHTFLYAVKNNKQGAFTFTRLSDEQYEEVLRRFNENRK